MPVTLRPEMPIWDKYVVQNLGLKVSTQNVLERLQKTKELYAKIVQCYADFMETENAAQCLKKFDEVLPDYTGISNVKKIDFYLWSIRKLFNLI